jgi:hypothetical protein
MVLSTAEIHASREHLLDTRSSSRMRMFEQVLGGFAHALNNELTVLTQGAAMLSAPRGLPAVELREVASDVRGAGDAIAELVRDLQSFERVTKERRGGDAHGALHALLGSAARIVSLITLLPCELDDGALPAHVQLALPGSLAISWLLEAALLVADATSVPRAARITALPPAREADEGDAFLKIVVTSAISRPVKRDGLSALSGECDAWGVRVAPLANGLRMELPLLADERS